jgi:hypothetical protein
MNRGLKIKMKKFVLGLLTGVLLTASTAIYASDSIQAVLWPVEVNLNGSDFKQDPEYAVLQYNGRAYVPIRSIADHLMLGVNYSDKDGTLSIQNNPGLSNHTLQAIWSIQYRLQQGDSTTRIKQILGDPSITSKDPFTKGDIWRYDFGAKPDYIFPDPNTHNLDMTGLENGDINAQAYIVWTLEGTLAALSLCFINKPTGHIIVYFIHEDGTNTRAIYE